MFKKYLYQSLAFFGKNQVGDSLVRMVADVRIVSNFFIKSVFAVIRNALLLIMYAGLALALNTKLFLLSLILLPVFSLAINFLGNKIKKYAKRIQTQSSAMFSNVEESLNSMRIVKAFSREEHEMGKFENINHRNFKAWRKSMIYKAVNIPLSELNGTIMGIIVLMIGGKAVLTNATSFSLGAFTAFLLAIFSMMHPIKKITQAYADIKKALVSLDRIYEILNRKSEIMTSAELKDISLRWELMKKIKKGVSQRKIASDLGISLCKITRGSKILKNNKSVSNKILIKMEKE
jgi:subfamily B ATP-binding cassette protein MsbA